MKRVATFSIVGYDPRNGDLGIAVESKFLAVGAVVPWARAGVGAVAIQSWANTTYGPRGLDMLEQGLDPEEVIKRLVVADDGALKRQVGIVDAQGRAATFTGPECYGWAGGITGPNFAAQGNILVSEDTVRAMAETFVQQQASGEGELADHLVAALAAGQAAGGDSRGQQSAALLVVREHGGYANYNDRYVDLRVEDHPRPIAELHRILELHQLYFQPTDMTSLVAIEGSVLREVRTILQHAGYLRENPAAEEFEAVTRHALVEFCDRENLEDRMQEGAQIDPVVLRYMRRYGEHAAHRSFHAEEGTEPTHLHITRPGQREDEGAAQAYLHIHHHGPGEGE